MLVPFTKDHIEQLTSWFPDEVSLAKWSGPGFRYPFTEDTFFQDLNTEKLPSFCLFCEQGKFAAFGQFYNRLERIHLARLVVNPELRGKGIAERLIYSLIQKGIAQFKLNSASLFVLSDNLPAITAYQKAGFEIANYPTEIPLENCRYMIKAL